MAAKAAALNQQQIHQPLKSLEDDSSLAPPTRVPISGMLNGLTPSSQAHHLPPHAAHPNKHEHHNHTQQQSQQQPSSTTIVPASTSSTTSSTSTSTTTSTSSTTGAATVVTGSNLPTADRSNFKIYILPNITLEVEQRYVIREVIGQGAYGVVCSAFDAKTNSYVAVKKIAEFLEHRSLAKRTLRELKLVRSFHHENILGVERVMRPHSATFNNIYMVSELMETDLACVIRSPQELTFEHVQFFIYQVLRGLKYIHSCDVIHRDLKPRNLLVNSNCDLKICDFGLSRLDDPENHDRSAMSNYIATRWYRAPEVILGRKKYTKAVDMWSVGCILAELIGRKPIFPGRDGFHQITLILSILGTPPPPSPPQPKGNLVAGTAAAAASPPVRRSSTTGPSDDYVSALPKKPRIPFGQLYPRASSSACDLLDKLLQFDPEKRLTVEQALAHPFLEDLHCADDEPICTTLDPTDFYFEYLKLTKEELRVLIHQEIVNHYKEETFDANATPMEVFNTQSLANSLPKQTPTGKKARRKSF